MITMEDFDKVQICAGTVTSVSINKKARKPAYKVTLDFGPELGEKTSSAQLTELYRPEDLLESSLFAASIWSRCTSGASKARSGSWEPNPNRGSSCSPLWSRWKMEIRSFETEKRSP